MLSGVEACSVVMSRTQALTDEMWARIEPLLPPLKGAMGRPMTPHRTLVEGSIFRLRAGLAWRDLPAEFGPWQRGRIQLVVATPDF